MDGNSQVPDYPKLAGQNQDYLAKTLRDYKSGARKGTIMDRIAKGFSDEETRAIAAWYAQQK